MGDLGHISFVDVIDIAAVACLIYWVLRLIRGTQAISILVGLSSAILVYWISSFAELYALNWLLSHVFGSLLLVVIVVFQSDIRRLLAQVGRSPLLASFAPSQGAEVIEELVKSSVSLANKKIGALIVVERDADVSEYVEVGVKVDAAVSRELITSIFLPVSPLHDGAVVIQKERIAAAGCFLPLTMNPKFGVEYGTRHRAAIGLTEETDAVVIVISEEKGWVSLCVGGALTKGLDGPALRGLLHKHLRPDRPRFWKPRQENA